MVFFLSLSGLSEYTGGFQIFVGWLLLKMVCVNILIVCEKWDHQYKTNELLEVFKKYFAKTLALYCFHKQAFITYFRN